MISIFRVGCRVVCSETPKVAAASEPRTTPLSHKTPIRTVMVHPLPEDAVDLRLWVAVVYGLYQVSERDRLGPPHHSLQIVSRDGRRPELLRALEAACGHRVRRT